MTPARIQFLEWVRGGAAVMVALNHLALLESDAYVDFTRTWVDPGRVGVVAFFLVSGFVIPLSFESQSIRTFLIRRTTRLYPIYLLVLFAYMPILVASSDWRIPGWPEVTMNALMLQELVGFAAILGPAWTLSIEWVFYGQQIGAKRLGWLKEGWRLGYVWLAIYFAATVLERVTGRDLPTTFPMLLAVACLGHAWSRAYRRDLERRPVLRLGVACLVLVPIGATIGRDSGTLWNPVNYTLSFLLGIGLFAAVFMARGAKGSKSLLWFGAISYSLYLVHPVVHDGLGLIDDVPLWLTVILNLALVPLISWLAHKYIEQPSIDLGRRWTRRRPVVPQER